MAANKDWIPYKLGAFDIFQNIYCKGVHTNRAAWKITISKDNALQALKVIYDGYYAISKNKRTSSPNDVKSTIKARKDLKNFIRKLTSQEIKNNTNMTDSNRKRIGVPNAPAQKRDAKASNVSPRVSYSSKSGLIGNYKFTPKKKPKGQSGYLIKTGFYLLKEPVPAENQCTQTDLIGKASTPIIYDIENKGMLFVSYIRYRSTNGKLGKAATIYYGSV